MYGNSLEFELLGTDYTGIFHSGNTILIYGKYGIITYSNDLGINWKQSYVGQNNDVLKIISIDDKFYALSPEKIFISKDQGKSWEETSIHWEENFVDFCTDGNQIFIITENEILRMDKELKSDLNLLFQFDPFIKFTEMAIWGKYLFIIDAKTSIVRYNIVANIPEDTIFTGFSQQQIEKLKMKDSVIYVLLVSDEHSPSFELNYQFIRHKVLFSEDWKTWKIFAKDIPITREYLIEGNEAHTLSPKPIRENTYLTVSYVRANSQGLIEENNLAKPNTWIPYFQLIEKANTFQINAIERINDSVLVACGNNKTILISKDNGKNWTFASYFRPMYEETFFIPINQIVQRGKDTIVVLAHYRPYMYASFDGGATFRTLGIDTNFRRLLLSGYSCPITPPNGQLGYFILQKDDNRHPTGTIVTVKLNFVNNEYKTDTFLLKPPKELKLDSVEVAFFTGLFYFKEKIFMVIYLQRSSFSSPLIIVLDNDLKIIDTLFLPKGAPVPRLSDGNHLYSISSDSENTNVLRTTSLRSDWEVVASISQVGYNKPNEKVYINLGKVTNNCFILVKTIEKGSEYEWRLLLFDRANGYLDSIPIPPYSRLFSLNDMVFLLTREWLKEFRNLPRDTSSFEYPLPDIDGWKINNIFQVGSQDYISLEKKYSGQYFELYEGNFGRLKKVSTPNFVIEEVRPFLFCFPLYPNPALGYVNLAICWDAGFSMDDVDISLFNINGQKFEVPRSLVSQWEPNCGVVRFFLSNFPPGIYFINVKLKNSEWTIPFVLTD